MYISYLIYIIQFNIFIYIISYIIYIIYIIFNIYILYCIIYLYIYISNFIYNQYVQAYGTESSKAFFESLGFLCHFWWWIRGWGGGGCGQLGHSETSKMSDTPGEGMTRRC